MRLTSLVSQHNDTLRCNVCQWRCSLTLGQTGRCLVRRHDPEGLVVLSDGLVSAATIGPIEDFGFRHFFPDSMVLAVGSWGTPFPAHHDESHHALLPEDPKRQRRLAPDRLVEFAQERLARGIIWTFNDPAVNLEHMADAMRLARGSSRITGVITGGLWTRAALDEIGTYLDGINLMVYGSTNTSYQRLAGISEWRGILAGAEYAVKQWRCHLEITTPIATAINDSATEITGIAEWILSTFGPQVPWRIIPMHDTDTTAASNARIIAKNTGLSFIYGSDPHEATRCPNCGVLVIERTDAKTRMIGIENGRCEACDTDLGLRNSVFKAS